MHFGTEASSLYFGWSLYQNFTVLDKSDDNLSGGQYVYNKVRLQKLLDLV